MKKVILLGAMLLLAFTSCSKSDENKEEIIEPQEVARYYVKFEVTFSTLTSFHNLTSTVLSCSTENGMKTMSFSDKKTFTWENTYGPVSNNFLASLKCDSKGAIINAKISVSKNSEPFVVKAEGQKESSLSLQYKINF